MKSIDCDLERYEYSIATARWAKDWPRETVDTSRVTSIALLWSGTIVKRSKNNETGEDFCIHLSVPSEEAQ